MRVLKVSLELRRERTGRFEVGAERRDFQEGSQQRKRKEKKA